MHSRGQSGLDAVTAMVVALLVLTAFGPVSNAFQASQKEISLRQQLRENVALAGDALTYAHWYRSPDPFLASSSFASGNIPLFSIREIEHAQGYECHPDVFSSVIQLKILKSDSGLAQDIVESRSISLPSSVAWSSSKVSFSSCEQPLELLP